MHRRMMSLLYSKQRSREMIGRVAAFGSWIWTILNPKSHFGRTKTYEV